MRFWQGGVLSKIIGRDGAMAADVYSESGKNRVAVAANITSIGGGIVPTISKKLRYVDMNVASNGIARGATVVASAFVTVFSYSGSGQIFSFILNLETKDSWVIKFTVDGEDVFGSSGILSTDIHSDAVYDLDDSGKTLDEAMGFGMFWGSHDRLIWTGPVFLPVKYDTSISISIARVAASASKKFNAGLVVLSKET